MNVELVEELVRATKDKLDDVEGIYNLDDDGKLYYKRRLATLAGGVAVIHVGGTTEVEMNERRDRIEDAVEAVKAAIVRGIAVGGGYTFLKCHHLIYDELIDRVDTKYEKGVESVLESITEPFSQMCYNADIDYERQCKYATSIVQDEGVLDLFSDDLVSLSEYKVYDPAGVLIDSLTNAVSVAKSILSIERVICY